MVGDINIMPATFTSQDPFLVTNLRCVFLEAQVSFSTLPQKDVKPMATGSAAGSLLVSHHLHFLCILYLRITIMHLDFSISVPVSFPDKEPVTQPPMQVRISQWSMYSIALARVTCVYVWELPLMYVCMCG